ncbi:hypothetical protein SUGI_0763780 [Cryptomeria japonica]|nr:hypothetical protein SUGI_0763780 [Cryptomeria japonica]
MATDSLFVCYCFLSVLYMLSLPHNCHSLTVDGGDSIALGASLTGNQSIVSKNGTFELGFFCPNGTNNWYIGIWYAQITEKTIIWVANRETPIRNKPGVLKLSTDGYLKLYDSEGRSIWSTRKNQKAIASRAIILDSGSFAMLGGHTISEIVWESFLYPTNTILSGMKVWKGIKLTSWRSSSDPAPGPFSFQMDPTPGKTDFLLLYNNNISYLNSGEWVGNQFTNMPEMSNKDSSKILKTAFVKISPTRMYFTFDQISLFDSFTQRVVLDKSGDLAAYNRISGSSWNLIWSIPRDLCLVYNLCGAYGACNSNNLQFCSCLEGFKPRDNRAWFSQDWWLSGCVRSSPLHCSATNGTTDGFLQKNDISLAEEKAVSYSQYPTLSTCTAACLENCSCKAFDHTNSTPPICRMWFGDLFNVRVASNNQPIFLRMAATELQQSISSGGSNQGRVLSISLPAGTAFVLVSAFLVIMFLRWRRGMLGKGGDMEGETLPASLRTFTYKELRIATNNFRDKLGKGAFGSVFRGALPDNTLVAVKKLEGSTQVEKQFRAEISTIGNIQHVNLVRLCGFCTEGSQRLLVYEYMPNGSLNSFLFAGSQKLLDWKTRFEIALGTARALVYLHEECRDQIIHSDIKPENILLDSDFNPKVADFGLAKLVGRDFSRVLTSMRGTRGYIAPEWIDGLAITSKADVYSFGMMLLEMISGRRNVDMSVKEHTKQYFPIWAATQILNGNMMSIVDERIAIHADVEEVRRATLASLVCILKDENERPSMAQVILMLQGKMNPDTQQVMRSLQYLVEY